ncbi:hypothetical protein [Agrococcus terreus]|uniref:Uncharacterized protein n=1 Tax=Agrococcus terreus TaxID=574649 RepID=A0ABQ2KIE5_9MICO|nr:hypothetical protein [Agrococcus terreus]GGN84448.1 hypothetical protein GCM10010968_16170 [Agrococcus terreus]
MARTGVGGAVAAAAAAAATALLCGCATPAPEPSSPPAAPTVLLEVLQLRGDVADGHVQLRVTNEGELPLEVERAEYRSSRWSAPMVHDEPATVPAGARRNLRLQLPEPTCDAGPIAQVAVLELAGGARVEQVPADPLGQLEGLDDAACALRAFAARAGAVRWLAPSIPADGAGPAVLRLEVAPRGGGDGDVLGRLEAVQPTPLLVPVDGDGRRLDALPLGVDVVAGAAPSVVEVPLEPGRCDLHAIAEDKQGTILRIVAELDGERSDLLLASADAQRDALLTWAVERCAALGAGP